jgi:hypothetical protein
MDIITRKEAQQLGLTRYFDGKPCKRGHIAERWVSSPHCLACKAERRKADRAKTAVRNARYYQQNRQKLIQDAVAYKRSRLKTDNAHRAEHNLRRRLLTAVGSQGTYRADGFNKLVGCSSNYLKAYLEIQWEDGMSWENYGRHGWHIDHIRPCASFDLTDPAQQRECFHYTNLQPLWAAENIQKSDKWAA